MPYPPVPLVLTESARAFVERGRMTVVLEGLEPLPSLAAAKVPPVPGYSSKGPLQQPGDAYTTSGDVFHKQQAPSEQQLVVTDTEAGPPIPLLFLRVSGQLPAAHLHRAQQGRLRRHWNLQESRDSFLGFHARDRTLWSASSANAWGGQLTSALVSTTTFSSSGGCSSGSGRWGHSSLRLRFVVQRRWLA